MSPRSKNLVIALLAIATVGSGVHAWQLSRGIRTLETSVAKADGERAGWQKRVWDAEKRPVEREVNATPPEALALVKDLASSDVTPPTSARRENPRGDRGMANNLATLMEDPEFAKAWTLQQKAALDSRFASLFKRLNLSPAALDTFKNLLVEKQSAMMDVMTAARSEGLTGRESRDELRQLVSQTQAELDASIKASIGDAAYAQYKSFEQTQPQRNLVNQLDQRLSYSGVPLTDAQSDQLVQILAATSPQRGGGGGSTNIMAGALPMVAGAGGAEVRIFSGGNTITDETINRAQGVLATPQLDALRQLQAEQRAQQQLSQMMRNARNPKPNEKAPASGKNGGG